MKIEYMRLYVDICELKSINRAAEKNYLTQQGLSKIVRGMETELDMKLLSRTNQGIELTTDGDGFLQTCYKILHQYDSFVQSKYQKEQSDIIDLYMTSSLSKLFTDIYETKLLGRYSISVNERDNDRLMQYIMQEKEGFVVIVLKNHEYMELKNRGINVTKIGDMNSVYYICHKNNLENCLHDGKFSLDAFCGQFVTFFAAEVDRYAGHGKSMKNTICVSDIEAYKKILQHENAMKSVNTSHYKKIFRDDFEDYVVLDRMEVEPLSFCLVNSLKLTEETQKIEKELVAYLGHIL